MRNTAAALFVLAAAIGPAMAQWYDTNTGKPVADTEWRKSTTGLGAAMILTTQAEAFLKEWQESPESHAPNVKTTSQAKRGEIVTALLVFSGCGGSTGTCNATIGFKVINPDGSVYGDIPASSAWSGPSPKPRLIALSRANLQIRIEPTDPLGEYTVLGTLREGGTGSTLSLKQTFRVVE